jgi:opacity protein-like surface antigen
VRKLIVTSLAIFLMTLPASAITGLGIGIHAGKTINYNYGQINNDLATIADSIGIIGVTDILKFDEDLMTIGAHVKVATLPIIDFYAFADYSWKKKEIYSNLDFKLSDFALGVSAKKMFGVTLIKPFVGAGAEMHKLAYSIESNAVSINGLPVAGMDLLIPDDQNKLGFHVLAGVELNFPIFPVDPYAQYRYTWITTKDKATKYGLLEFGVTLSL